MLLIGRCYGHDDHGGCQPLPELFEDLSSLGDTAVNHGGLPIVLGTMSSFPNNKLIQSSGCAAISSISARRKVAVHLVTKLDGVMVIAAAMKQFPDCTSIQKTASWIFADLSLFQDCRDAIIQAGGLECLGTAIRRFTTKTNAEHEVIQDKARCAMLRLI